MQHWRPTKLIAKSKTKAKSTHLTKEPQRVSLIKFLSVKPQAYHGQEPRVSQIGGRQDPNSNNHSNKQRPRSRQLRKIMPLLAPSRSSM